MIILLQSVQFNFAGIFDLFRIIKGANLILFQSLIDFITKYVRYYKVRQLLQSET